MNKAIPFYLLITLLVISLAACNSPQPLPVAPTPIPTLIPAEMPEPDTTAPLPEMAEVIFPAAAPDAAAGEAVYQANCAGCHGEDGVGVVEGARDFSDVDYLRGAAPVAFFQAITDGKGDMPGFAEGLTDEERWNTTYYLWNFAVTADELTLGETVFQANCVACHGADGAGTIPQAPSLADAEYVASYPASQFFNAVTGGKGIMPAWQDRLSADERWAAVEYGRVFGYQSAGQ
jgi:mono/diheme cytochrome c family protein